MPIQSIPIGPPTFIAQNVVYALPAVSTTYFTGSGGATVQLSSDAAFSTFAVLTPAAGIAQVPGGGYIRCTSGNITITLSRA